MAWTGTRSVSGLLLMSTVLLLCCSQVVRAQQRNRGRSPGPCEESSCYPATGDLLIGRENRLKSTSTCGLVRQERYCIVSHLEDQINKCFVCDSRQPYSPYNKMSHRVENIVSTFRPDWKLRWWQAENGRPLVSIQLDLEAEFHFTHLIMRFKTFRPAAMFIERSYDFGKTWKVYRYFAYDCAEAFPEIPSAATIPIRRIQDVVCESRYSDVAPSTEGEVIFRVLPPSVEIEDPYSEEVQDLLKMTNLRVNFTKLHTLGDNLLDNRLEIKEKYYYSIYHMVVRGSCSCYGHASHCEPTPDQTDNPDMVYGKCQCTHNTMGLNCERCEDFYNDLPWAPARRGKTNACKRCDCNGHATRCHFDPAVYEATGRVSGGVCDDCQHNTMGHHCEECRPFFYQDPGRPVTDPNVCRPCDCDPIGSEHGGECESKTDIVHDLIAGRCICKRYVEGRRCDTCMDGYWNMRSDNYDGCEACGCFQLGTVGNYGCDKETGECRCKRYVTGRQCNQCMPGYWGMSDDLQGCKPCDCDIGGALDNMCDQQTGQCSCRPNVVGRRCEQVKPSCFVATVDWERYEAELARGIGNTQVVVREVIPGRQVTWTGTGFMRVTEGSSLEFLIDDIPVSMEYEIIIRYEAQMPLRWDDVRMTIIRPGPVDQRGPCANSIPQDDLKAFVLSQGLRQFVITPDVCLERGVTYKLRLDFYRYQSNRVTPEAGILVDSIVLMPGLPSHPLTSHPDQGQNFRDDVERFRCFEHYRAAPSSPLSEVCKKYIFSSSVSIYNGAQDCECDPTGSYSTLCDIYGGQCQCKPNVIGRRCDQCAPGSFGFGPAGCTLCGCNPLASRDGFCDLMTGQCTCVANAYGRQCDQCQRGYYGYPSCRQCQCSGRADECDNNGRCLSCRDYTGGMHCERCADGYYGDPRPGSMYPCRPCMCPGGAGSGFQHGDTCRLDMRSNHVICDCQTGYAGMSCDRCADNYFGNPLISGGTCERCSCNRNIDFNVPGSCDATTGECLKCQYNTEGFNCERCRSGYYGDATRQNCQACVCNILGTQRNAGPCNPVTGQCVCLPHVIGIKCDQCERNYWKLASGLGCESCACDPYGSLSPQCNEFDGQCQCRDDRGGRDCSECIDNHWGDPRVQCIPCNCNSQGSVTLQCDRRTGRCECAPGVTGDRCDRCARGTTGVLPHCEPCGECFDNWDQIISELQIETTILLKNGSEIKYGGAPGAFDREFSYMESKLDEVKKILAGSNISVEGLEDLQAKLRQLRANLTGSDSSLDKLDENIQDTTNRVEEVNRRIEAIKTQVDSLKQMADDLQRNATTIKELDVSGAYNSTRDSYRRSMDAQRRADLTTDTVRSSQQVRQSVDQLIRAHQSEFDRHYDSNEVLLRNLTTHLDQFRNKIRDLNDVVCDGAGDPCDNVCGGAGCDKCGGSISCADGAVTKSINAISMANRSETIIRTKLREAENQQQKVVDAKDLCEMAHSDALMAHERAQFAKNQSESSRTELQMLIDAITTFLEQHGAKTEDVRNVAEEVLRMTISLTPQQISDLARQITDTIRGLTDIDKILEATRADLERARELERQANGARDDANDVLATAIRILEALKKARDAQDAAEQSITNTRDQIDGIESDLDVIETAATTSRESVNLSRTRVYDLRDRVARLKTKFTENEVKVQQAREAAQEASELATAAEEDASELETKYQDAVVQLERKFNETRIARERAEQLKQRATTMYTSTKSKVDRLQAMEKIFRLNENTMLDLSQQSHSLLVRITRYLTDIQEAAQFHSKCA